MEEAFLFEYKARTELTDRQQKVFDALETLKEATDKEITEFLGWTINRVSGRVHELIEMNIAEVIRFDLGQFGSRVRVTKLTGE